MKVLRTAPALLAGLTLLAVGLPPAVAAPGDVRVEPRAALVAAEEAAAPPVLRLELQLSGPDGLTEVALTDRPGAAAEVGADQLVCEGDVLVAGGALGCAAEVEVLAEVLTDCAVTLDLLVTGRGADGAETTTEVRQDVPVDGCPATPAPTPTDPASPEASPTPSVTAEPSPEPSPSASTGSQSAGPTTPAEPSPSASTAERQAERTTGRAADSPIARKYAATGGPSGPLGRETTSERAISGGRWAGYEHGRIYWSADTGAHTVVGGFLEEFVADSGSRTHGFPSTDKVCGAVQGGCYQLFSSGNRVTWAKGAGHHFTVGDFRKAWRRAGYASGKLGYPIGDKRCGLPAGGCYQSFQKGSVHWSSATGAHWSTGGIRREWASYGWERGILGYPESDERCNSGGCWQWFQHGVVEWKPGRGTWATPDFRPVVRRTTAADVEDTYRSGCPVGPSSLRTITMSYWGFDGRARRGVMIVRSSMVDGVVAAFEEAYRARYEIYRMDNPNRWGGDDPKQMYANNTSGFNCRSVVGNPYAVSPHSYGIAVDINTVQNPYKDARGTWWPSNGHKYILGGGLNRPKEHPAVLTTGSTIVKALEKRGWFWGGRWANRDYQHFEND